MKNNSILALVYLFIMLKNIVSVYLLIIFLVFLTGPSIMYMVDDSMDISILLDSGEEEEKGKENIKDIQFSVSELDGNECDFFLDETENGLGYFFKNYPKPHMNLISPPPEHFIL